MLFLNNAFTKDITEYNGEVLKEVKTVDGKIYLSNGAIIKEGVVGKFFDIATNDKYGTVFEADGPDEIGPIVGFAPVTGDSAPDYFALQLQKLRKQSSITQEQLAAKLGVTAQAVSKWENGSYPDGDLLPKIADIFDVSIDNLYGRGEERCLFEQQVVNHMRAIADSSQDSSAEWLKNYLNIIWAMQLTAWRECRYYYDIPDFKDSNGTVASECTCNTGVTYMRLNKDFRYFTYIE